MGEPSNTKEQQKAENNLPLNPKLPSVLETLRIRVQELEQDRDTAHAQLKTVEQECNDEREEHERVQLRLRIALQKVTGERDTANAKLKNVEQERDTAKAQLETVEQERDRANERYTKAIAEWARLERAAYGTPGLGGI